MPKANQYIVYGLIDPRDQQLRYIGKSNYGLKRAKQHFEKSSRKIRSYKNNWINSVFNDGLKPSIIVLSKCDSSSDAFEEEEHLIRYFKYVGCRLTNKTNGGDGFTKKHSSSTKRKLSEIGKLNHSRLIVWRKCLEQKRKPVIGFNENRSIYLSSMSNAKAFGFNFRCISNCVLKKQKLYQGLTWVLCEEFMNYSD